MKCPCCKAELIPWKKLRLETLTEHVSDPNGEISKKQSVCCSNKNCLTIGSRGPIVFWNGEEWEGEGDMFISHEYEYNIHKYIRFIDNNNAAFGSFARKCNIEIHKKDENKLLHTFKFIWKGYKVYSNWAYKSNEDGDILRKTFHLQWVSPKGYILVGGPPPFHGIHMLKYTLGCTFRDWKGALKSPKYPHHINELKRDVINATYPRVEWWRKVNAHFAKWALARLATTGNELAIVACQELENNYGNRS